MAILRSKVILSCDRNFITFLIPFLFCLCSHTLTYFVVFMLFFWRGRKAGGKCNSQYIKEQVYQDVIANPPSSLSSADALHNHQTARFYSRPTTRANWGILRAGDVMRMRMFPEKWPFGHTHAHTHTTHDVLLVTYHISAFISASTYYTISLTYYNLQTLFNDWCITSSSRIWNANTQFRGYIHCWIWTYEAWSRAVKESIWFNKVTKDMDKLKD